MKIIHLAIFTCGLFTSSAYGGDAEKELIGKIVDAYGGHAVSEIKKLKIENKYKTPAVGQSASPSQLDIGVLKDRVVVDFVNKRVSEISWTLSNNGPRLGERFNNGQTGHSINYMRGTHVDREDYTFHRVAGGNLRMLDLGLVKLLASNPEGAVLGDKLYLKGRLHQALTFPMPETSGITIYVDVDSYLISKMTRSGELSYVYSDYQEVDGVKYAGSTDFFIGAQPNMLSLSRNLTVNPNVVGEFEMPEGIKTIPGGMLDTSKMMTKEVADGVFLVGQRAGFSMFVDAGDYFIGVGGYPKLTERFNAVKELDGLNKPLKFQVVTHHHSDHIAGLDEAIELGAKLVTVRTHVQPLKAALGDEGIEAKLLLVDEKVSLADGKVKLFNIATSHSDQFLLFYMPEEQLIFSADHFSTQVKNALPGPSFGAVTFLRALERLNVEIKTLYDAHTPHVFT
ncbi:MAG: MBL fold metallo-hydrolase, partial [Kordiimonas sp.]